MGSLCPNDSWERNCSQALFRVSFPSSLHGYIDYKERRSLTPVMFLFLSMTICLYTFSLHELSKITVYRIIEASVFAFIFSWQGILTKGLAGTLELAKGWSPCCLQQLSWMKGRENRKEPKISASSYCFSILGELQKLENLSNYYFL